MPYLNIIAMATPCLYNSLKSSTILAKGGNSKLVSPLETKMLSSTTRF